MAHANISMGDLMAQAIIEVSVAGLKSFAIRKWVGVQLIKIAAWIMWFGECKVADETDYESIEEECGMSKPSMIRSIKRGK